jgi:hypothetical protein
MKIQEEKKVVRLKRPILACAVLLGAAMGLQATPVCPTTGNYATLQALGSCTIEGVTFSGFTYGSGAVGAPAVPADQLNYETIPPAPGSPEIGFSFMGIPLAASAGATNDISIGYDVTGTNITDAAASIASIVAPSGSGASATLAETICPGHTIAGCTSSLSISAYNIAGVAMNETPLPVTFAPVGFVGVLKDVDVIGGTGVASLSAFTDTVSLGGGSVPEPGFYGVLGGGMGAIIMFARRRKKTVKT